MKEELEELKGLLVSEREEKALKVTALAQQQELYQKLTLEATKTNEHKTKMAELLSASDAGRNSLEAKVHTLKHVYTYDTFFTTSPLSSSCLSKTLSWLVLMSD